MNLVLLVGPPGSGKTIIAEQYEKDGYIRISQDKQGKEGHRLEFSKALFEEKNIIVDRLNFDLEQRNRYLKVAKQLGYTTKIVVLHENRTTCLERCLSREHHETIKNKEDASRALDMFFRKYERVKDYEADVVERCWPNKVEKTDAIWSDLDGTLCNVEHRRHFVRTEGKKKDWKSFFQALVNDTINVPVMETLKRFNHNHDIVYCSGRSDDYRGQTVEWLQKNEAPNGYLFMRPRNDFRDDTIVKEIMLEFEVFTRYNILFCLDDRDSVVSMLRKHGLTVFQVAPGDF